MEQIERLKRIATEARRIIRLSPSMEQASSAGVILSDVEALIVEHNVAPTQAACPVCGEKDCWLQRMNVDHSPAPSLANLPSAMETAGREEQCDEAFEGSRR